MGTLYIILNNQAYNYTLHKKRQPIPQKPIYQAPELARHATTSSRLNQKNTAIIIVFQVNQIQQYYVCMEDVITPADQPLMTCFCETIWQLL